jgi:hypothetical protein
MTGCATFVTQTHIPRLEHTHLYLSYEFCYFVLTSVLSWRTRSFQCVIKLGILYTYNVVITRGVTSRDIYLCLTETVCVLNFMTSNEYRRSSYRHSLLDTCSLHSGELVHINTRRPNWVSTVSYGVFRIPSHFWSRDNVAEVATNLWAERGSNPGNDKIDFSSSQHSGRLWVPPSYYSMGTGFFSRE